MAGQQGASRDTQTGFAAWGWLVEMEMDVVGLLDIRLAYEQAIAESGGRVAEPCFESGRALAADFWQRLARAAVLV